MTGRTVSHYQVGRKLGEGGMGAVYAAHDQRLSRTVALKVLIAEGDNAAEGSRRLLREARTAAALNHPNICTIHEILEMDGKAILVMEYVDGQTLREMALERPLPIAQALDIAVQIASALQVAHDLGIVHRDVKSGNVMVGPSGQAKVLDFGLAQWLEKETLTASRICAGTPAYMSPEQVCGRNADHRSDIWGLGVIVYEMVTGALPFKADSTDGVCHSILNEDPEPLTAVRTGIPIELDRIVAKALAKSPEERYQHVADFLVDLKSVQKLISTEKDKRRTSTSSVSPPAPTIPAWRRSMYWAVLAVLCLATAGSLWFAYEKWGADTRTMRFISRLPTGQTFAGVDFFGSAIAITRDGESIVYVAREGKKTQLWRRKIGEDQAHEIAGTAGGLAPFLSPDKRWVGYVEGRSLKRIGFQGGSAQMIQEGSSESMFSADIAFFGASWSPEGDPIIASECTRGLRRYYTKMRSKETITDVLAPKLFRQHQFPQILPGGRYILFTTWVDESDSAIAVLDQQTGKERVILSPGTYARYLPTGHLVYGWKNNLYAAAFDLDELKVTGPSVLAVEGVMMNLVRGSVQYDVSATGTLVYIPGSAVRSFRNLAWVDRTGKTKPIEQFEARDPGALRLSPEGASVLTMGKSHETGQTKIETFDLDRNSWRLVAAGKGGNWWPVWHSDGRTIFFNGIQHVKENFYSVWQGSISGTAPHQLVEAGASGHQQPLSVSKDGKYLLYQQWSDQGKTSSLWVLPLAGNGSPWKFSNTSVLEFHGEFSPNGKWVAFATRDSGMVQVRVRAFPDGRETHQVSAAPGWEPLWSRDGRKLYYRSTDGRRVYTVDFSDSPTLKIGTPELLLEGNFQPAQVWGRVYDLSPDGQRFLLWLNDPVESREAREYHVILNWAEELKRIARPAD